MSTQPTRAKSACANIYKASQALANDARVGRGLTLTLWPATRGAVGVCTALCASRSICGPPLVEQLFVQHVCLRHSFERSPMEPNKRQESTALEPETKCTAREPETKSTAREPETQKHGP